MTPEYDQNDIPQMTPEEEEAIKREAEQRERAKKRAACAEAMAGLLTPVLIGLTRKYGPELVLNGLMDLSAGICSISFEEESIPDHLAAMAARIADTDWKRHRARHFAGKLGVVGNRSEGGIILPKGVTP